MSERTRYKVIAVGRGCGRENCALHDSWDNLPYREKMSPDVFKVLLLSPDADDTAYTILVGCSAVMDHSGLTFAFVDNEREAGRPCELSSVNNSVIGGATVTVEAEIIWTSTHFGVDMPEEHRGPVERLLFPAAHR